MKNKSILLLLSLFALLSSCHFLEEDPRSQLPKEALSTGDETLLYLNTLGNLYTLVGGSEESQGLMGTYRGVYDLNTFTTDEAIMPTRGSTCTAGSPSKGPSRPLGITSIKSSPWPTRRS